MLNTPEGPEGNEMRRPSNPVTAGRMPRCYTKDETQRGGLGGSPSGARVDRG